MPRPTLHPHTQRFRDLAATGTWPPRITIRRFNHVWLAAISIIYQIEPFFVFFVDDIHRTKLSNTAMKSPSVPDSDEVDQIHESVFKGYTKSMESAKKDNMKRSLWYMIYLSCLNHRLKGNRCKHDSSKSPFLPSESAVNLLSYTSNGHLLYSVHDSEALALIKESFEIKRKTGQGSVQAITGVPLINHVVPKDKNSIVQPLQYIMVLDGKLPGLWNAIHPAISLPKSDPNFPEWADSGSRAGLYTSPTDQLDLLLISRPQHGPQHHFCDCGYGFQNSRQRRNPVAPRHAPDPYISYFCSKRRKGSLFIYACHWINERQCGNVLAREFYISISYKGERDEEGHRMRFKTPNPGHELIFKPYTSLHDHTKSMENAKKDNMKQSVWYRIHYI
ncbi:hypothetical protein K435DRAFT_791156 [Dendrothele bispora CBS 962.96]|uniref:Uncharacterized protein n=1 Tax=Dendrothele bispora (strain CBS 962.96) TaxID=1314807 RepID=A0A4S8MN19_DENBC|nr:hypothetical protein K435DRAFT_791156 [Dendrothele bispora CBS 962.96]